MTNIVRHPTHRSGPAVLSHDVSDRVTPPAVIERASVTLLADRCLPRMNSRIWEIQALVLEAIARDAVGDVVVAEQALERALELAEPDGLLFPFLFDPAPALLQRHPQLVASHGQLVSKISELLARTESAFARPRSDHPVDQLTDAETRVLRYLPTHLTAVDIANELYVSANTVKTHLRHLYAKLGVHDRKEAVERARALGLLPSLLARPQRRKALTAPPPPPAAAALL
jgi:LuxR family maltose regulon positive regulatory protein